eukprot:1186108-Prorocentrum_minimum.AAC.1
MAVGWLQMRRTAVGWLRIPGRARRTAVGWRLRRPGGGSDGLLGLAAIGLSRSGAVAGVVRGGGGEGAARAPRSVQECMVLTAASPPGDGAVDQRLRRPARTR